MADFVFFYRLGSRSLGRGFFKVIYRGRGIVSGYEFSFKFCFECVRGFFIDLMLRDSWIAVFRRGLFRYLSLVGV